jgi:hypothetical protein
MSIGTEWEGEEKKGLEKSYIGAADELLHVLGRYHQLDLSATFRRQGSGFHHIWGLN